MSHVQCSPRPQRVFLTDLILRQPLEEGDYLIHVFGVLPVVRHVAALSNNKFVMVIPEDIHTPFPWKLVRS